MLETLDKARRYHEFQMLKIESLLDGKDAGELPSIYKTECNFGKWLYDDDMNLKILLGSIFYKNVDGLHAQWHLEYRNIYLLYFTEPDQKGISKPKKVTAMDVDKGRSYYADMKITTSKLIKMLASCKRRLEALSADKFQ